MKIRIEYQGESSDPDDALPFRLQRGWAVGAALDGQTTVPEHWTGPADTPNRLILGDLDEAIGFARSLALEQASKADVHVNEIVICPIEEVTSSHRL